MTEMVKIAEIAKRLGVDLTTVRRLIARESEALQIELHRGKGDKLLLRKGELIPQSMIVMATSTSSNWCQRPCRIE
jgi:predicted DNA-binding transcriptional regulator YafY